MFRRRTVFPANQIVQLVQPPNVMYASQNTMQMARIVLFVQLIVIHVQRTYVQIVKLGIMLQLLNVSNVANIVRNVMLPLV